MKLARTSRLLDLPAVMLEVYATGNSSRSRFTHLTAARPNRGMVGLGHSSEQLRGMLEVSEVSDARPCCSYVLPLPGSCHLSCSSCSQAAKRGIANSSSPRAGFSHWLWATTVRYCRCAGPSRSQRSLKMRFASVCTALAASAARALISSRSVYEQPVPLGLKETAPTVPANAAAQDGDYPALKRGAELAAVEVFGERALLARAGLILGPYEDAGRLTWWLNRIAVGGEVLAPGPPDLPIQFIDARDLATFVLDAALDGHGGPYNVVSRRGHATMGSLLQACETAAGGDDVRLTWLDPAAITAAGLQAWTELPIWLPPDSPSIAIHATDVEHAYAAGLRCRPVLETVRDTWRWLTTLNGSTPIRSGLKPTGLASSREHAALEAWHTTQLHQA